MNRMTSAQVLIANTISEANCQPNHSKVGKTSVPRV
jgi:hypothetical protein